MTPTKSAALFTLHPQSYTYHEPPFSLSTTDHFDSVVFEDINSSTIFKTLSIQYALVDRILKLPVILYSTALNMLPIVQLLNF